LTRLAEQKKLLANGINNYEQMLNMKNIVKSIVTVAILIVSANASSQSVGPPKPIYPMSAGSRTGAISVEQVMEAAIKFHIPNAIGETAQSKAEDRLVIQPFLGGPDLRKQSIQSLIDSNRLIVDFSIYSAMARSGRVFLLEKLLETQPEKTLITFTPKEVTNYQFGLIKFDVPNISPQALQSHVKTAKLQVRLEVISAFSAEATIATLRRSIKSRATVGYIQELHSGVKFDREYSIDTKGVNQVVLIAASPYRNGCKLIVKGNLAGQEIGPAEIDFSAIVEDLRLQLESIVRS
jgi:hypothetical protein